MNACADSTRLRTHLDHPDAGLDAHLDGCQTCTGLLRSVAADAGFTRRALAALDPPRPEDEGLDVDAALATVLARTTGGPAPHSDSSIAQRRSPLGDAGRRVALGAAAAAVVLVAAVTPAGRGAVAGVLDAFRGERVQVVTVDLDAWGESLEPGRLAALESIADVDVRGLVEPAQVAGAAAAATVAGIDAPAVAEAPDRWVAMAPGTARLVLVQRDGNGVPAALDGAALVVDVPGVAAAVYGEPDEAPRLVVGRSGRLVVRSEGAPLDAIRSFLLGRDELPADLREQLASIEDWRSTIPVPVPVDGPGWRELDIGGRAAVAFGDDVGLAALVLRQDPDGITFVGGRVAVRRAIELAAAA